MAQAFQPVLFYLGPSTLGLRLHVSPQSGIDPGLAAFAPGLEPGQLANKIGVQEK